MPGTGTEQILLLLLLFLFSIASLEVIQTFVWEQPEVLVGNLV